tara:strand:- start:218 stop:700 length:483 start_codon:yes stop_codon:yes gene_type:complete
MIKNIPLIILLVITISCGFKPIHKFSDDYKNDGIYKVKILNNVAREISEEISSNIINSNEDTKYTAMLTVNQNLTPLIVNTNGTVAKYRIEISISYELVDNKTSERLTMGNARGFAQYDIGTSEINNEDTKKSMIKIATKNAIQLMTTKIQNDISNKNDN